jgi:Flp pilus assembly protein TadD
VHVGVRLVVLSLVFIGCSARGPFKATPDTHEGSSPAPGSVTSQRPAESLESFIEKVREASARARPPDHKPLASAETTDLQLAAALLVAQTHPSADAYHRVADQYRRLGVADQAHDYLDRATVLAPRDTAIYQVRATMWRDGGFPDRALADAHRALYYAPSSASAHNTLGTVFQALGRHSEARYQFERAVSLDPTAAYALNNLCYAWILERQPNRAANACRAALGMDPTFRAARNNLGLAYAASGDIDAARRAFNAGGDPAAAEYNLGIVQLARHRYADAVTAFIAAQQMRPNWRIAAMRAKQAEKLAKAGAAE